MAPLEVSLIDGHSGSESVTIGKALFVHHGAYSSLGFIAERAEQRGSEVIALRCVEGRLDPRGFALVTLLGSDSAAYDDSLEWLGPELEFVHAALDHGVPTFGICFGAQLLARCLGGPVGPMARPELGWTTVESRRPELVEPGPWFQMHGDTFGLPPGALELAGNDGGVQAFEHGKALGVQFHPEVTEQHVRQWLAEASEFVARAGADPAVIIKETAALIEDARWRAHRLFDRVWERLGA